MLSVKLEAKEEGLVAFVDADLIFKAYSNLSFCLHPLN